MKAVSPGDLFLAQYGRWTDIIFVINTHSDVCFAVGLTKLGQHKVHFFKYNQLTVAPITWRCLQ